MFAAYAITVDPRHLALIADYMTFGGGYKPMNRYGMDSSSSPYHQVLPLRRPAAACYVCMCVERGWKHVRVPCVSQMSFETTTRFLANAALMGDTETIQSCSARLVMGRVVGSGTGAFELVHPVSL